MQRQGKVRGARVLLLGALGLALQACSIRGLAVRALGSSLAEAGSVFASDEDPELVRAAVPFALKTMEALLEEQPENRDLLLAACRGFVQYAYAFVETDGMLLEPTDYRGAQRLFDRAAKLYLRGRDYCLRAMEVEAPGIGEELAREPVAALASFSVEDVPLLFWTGAAWGAAISRSGFDPELTVDLPAVRALMERVLELDEAWDSGAAHGVMIALEAVPAEMGGSPERARANFARALELNGGRRAGTYVTLATTVAAGKEQDWREFEELLEKALAVDPDAEPSARVENLIAQRRARFLLDHIADYFVEYPEGEL